MFGCFDYGWSSSWTFSFFDMFFVFATTSPVECLSGLFFWILMDRLILLRDRELVFGCKFFWMVMVSSPVDRMQWCTLLIWFWSLVGRSLLIRNRESVFDSSLFWLFMVLFFGGPGVERWWNQKKRWKRTLRGCQIGITYGDDKMFFGLEGLFFFG